MLKGSVEHFGEKSQDRNLHTNDYGEVSISDIFIFLFCFIAAIFITFLIDLITLPFLPIIFPISEESTEIAKFVMPLSSCSLISVFSGLSTIWEIIYSNAFLIFD